jgi:hypothetical protein
MDDELFKTLWLAAGLILGEIVPPLFATSDIDKAVGKAACWFTLWLIYLAVSWLRLRRWRRMRFFRKLKYPQTACEGQWLQKINNERPFGVSCIEYDCESNGWIHRGCAFDERMALKARWETKSIHYDTALHKWYFAGQGCLMAESGNLLVQTNAFDIIVVMSWAAGRDVNTIDAKAADFNFQTTAGSHADCIFAVTLTRAVAKRNLVDEVRTMTLEERKQVFGLIDQAQGNVPALAA